MDSRRRPFAEDSTGVLRSVPARLLRRHEAAAYLGVSVATLDALRSLASAGWRAPIGATRNPGVAVPTPWESVEPASFWHHPTW